jgi:hypothetical protein
MNEIQENFDSIMRKMGLHKENLNPIQYQEMRRAFFAGVGSMISELFDTVNADDDPDSDFHAEQNMINLLTKRQREMSQFWESELKNS